MLLGTDYVYPRTTNKILRAFLKSKGVADADIMEEYTPFGHSDYQTIIAKIKKFAAEGKKTAVVSTINGDSNVPFYKELGNAGLKATDVPVVAFSVGEEELRGVDTKPLVGHLAAWNYFMSHQEPDQRRVHQEVERLRQGQEASPATRTSRVTNDPMEATYIGIHMWEQAVEKAKSTDTDKVIAAMAGQTFKAPSRLHVPRWTRRTTTCTSRCSSAKCKADGQFNVVWKTLARSRPQPWSPYIEGNDKKKGEPGSAVSRPGRVRGSDPRIFVVRSGADDVRDRQNDDPFLPRTMLSRAEWRSPRAAGAGGRSTRRMAAGLGGGLQAPTSPPSTRSGVAGRRRGRGAAGRARRRATTRYGWPAAGA